MSLRGSFQGLVSSQRSHSASTRSLSSIWNARISMLSCHLGQMDRLDHETAVRRRAGGCYLEDYSTALIVTAQKRASVRRIWFAVPAACLSMRSALLSFGALLLLVSAACTRSNGEGDGGVS